MVSPFDAFDGHGVGVDVDRLDPAAADMNDFVRHVFERRVVRHDDDGLFLLFGDVVQELENEFSRHVVERARRLVAQKQLRIFGKGARNGDALLLAPRKLRGKVV